LQNDDDLKTTKLKLGLVVLTPPGQVDTIVNAVANVPGAQLLYRTTSYSELRIIRPQEGRQ